MREERMLNIAEIALVEIGCTYNDGNSSSFDIMVIRSKESGIVSTLDLADIVHDFKNPEYIFDAVCGPYESMYGAIRDIARSLGNAPGFIHFDKFNVNYLRSGEYTESGANKLLDSVLVGLYEDERGWRYVDE